MVRVRLEELTTIGSEIQQIVEDTGCEYIDACVAYCEEKGMEIETLGDILKKHQSISSEIEREGRELNMLKGGANTEGLKFE